MIYQHNLIPFKISLFGWFLSRNSEILDLSWKEKVMSLARAEILQLELWLESAQLELITISWVIFWQKMVFNSEMVSEMVFIWRLALILGGKVYKSQTLRKTFITKGLEFSRDEVTLLNEVTSFQSGSLYSSYIWLKSILDL